MVRLKNHLSALSRPSLTAKARRPRPKNAGEAFVPPEEF
ncbi:hypothetical protein ACCUM_2716 [Candidatus Accumulibacter phosphatis]|uniref:Uncharacterized protein n=1 Tax=Candidatus Accumulibacter phosphatis TaxID=327160 RepID=A0A5S4EQK9_9PROT|nr:hypothetical protein ACCUM_2716 [Candidatus Accumulibacter phosphatis]